MSCWSLTNSFLPWPIIELGWRKQPLKLCNYACGRCYKAISAEEYYSMWTWRHRFDASHGLGGAKIVLKCNHVYKRWWPIYNFPLASSNRPRYSCKILLPLLARQGSVLEINNHPLAFICPDTKHSRHGAHLGFPPSLSLTHSPTLSLFLSQIPTKPCSIVVFVGSHFFVSKCELVMTSPLPVRYIVVFLYWLICWLFSTFKQSSRVLKWSFNKCSKFFNRYYQLFK